MGQIVTAMNTLTEYLESREKTPVVLVFVNTPYLPVFDIWYALYMINSAPDLIVIALDKTAYENLTQRGICCFFAGSDEFNNFLSLKIYDKHEVSVLSKLWLLRATAIRMILDTGADVLHTDCDAFWLGDVYRLFRETPADMTFSIAFSHPREVAQQWGFILCMGLFMIRNSENTRKFFSDFADRLESTTSPSDQAVLNEFLYTENTRWKRYRIRNYKTYLQKYDITIHVFGDHLVSRKRTHHGLYAYHPFLEGDIDKKVADSLGGIRKILGKCNYDIPP